MPFDQTLADQYSALGLGASQQGMALIGVMDRNLVQGLGVVNTTLIQANGSVTDDSAIIAALNTAAGSPQSGYQKGA